MHLVLAFLSAASCIALGALASRRLSARERAIGQWDAALQRMEAALDRGLDLPGLLRLGAGEQVDWLAQAADKLEAAPTLNEKTLLTLLPLPPLLTAAERQTLRDCLETLFSPSPEVLSQALAYTRAQWAHFRKISRDALESNGRLYCSLGWLAGAALFILIC